MGGGGKLGGGGVGDEDGGGGDGEGDNGGGGGFRVRGFTKQANTSADV